MTNNDEPALKLEQIEWLHGAAEEAAAVNLKMTMKPEEILQITSVLLALLAERDADKKRIADYQHQLSRYSMSPGEADQRRCESRVVRDALGYCMDSENVAPVDLYLKIEVLRQRIAELEARTLTVKFDPIAMEELGNKNQGKKHPYMFGAGYNSAVVSCKCALENACAAAGIKLEVGE